MYTWSLKKQNSLKISNCKIRIKWCLNQCTCITIHIWICTYVSYHAATMSLILIKLNLKCSWCTMVPIYILQLVKLTGHENPNKSFFSLPNNPFKSRYTLQPWNSNNVFSLKKNSNNARSLTLWLPELQEILVAFGRPAGPK